MYAWCYFLWLQNHRYESFLLAIATPEYITSKKKGILKVCLWTFLWLLYCLRLKTFYVFNFHSQCAKTFSTSEVAWLYRIWLEYLGPSKYTRVLLYWAEREYLQAKRLLTDCSFIFWFDAHTTWHIVQSTQKWQSELNHKS